MKRWEVTLNGKSALLYGECADDIKKIADDGGEIKPHTDTSYMEYVDKIKAAGLFLGNEKSKFKNREIYRLPHPNGYMLVKLSLDIKDGSYYDFAIYNIWKNNRFVDPIGWTLGTPKEAWDIASQNPLEFKIVSSRKYGEPKLCRPKELKGIKPVGSVEYITKHCSPQVFIKDDDVWVKHTDYFSPLWRPPVGEKTGMPQSYYLKKYFNTGGRKEKFIYTDNWAGIVLRNEAWLKLENAVPIIMCDNIVVAARDITDKQGKGFKCGWGSSESRLEWERFWEKVCKLIKEKQEV